MNYWLIKSEPKVYSLSDLEQEQETIWDGVRNFQVRNFLRQMNERDLAFFYHSNTKIPGIVGLTSIAKTGINDPTQFDLNSQYYDPKSTVESPRWQTVVVQFVETFPQMISLSMLKEEFNAEELLVVRRGNRLSVMPVPETVAQRMMTIGRSKPRRD